MYRDGIRTVYVRDRPAYFDMCLKMFLFVRAHYLLNVYCLEENFSVYNCEFNTTTRVLEKTNTTQCRVNV